MRDTIHGICRSCAAMCPIVIDREDGRAGADHRRQAQPGVLGLQLHQGSRDGEPAAPSRSPDRTACGARRTAASRRSPARRRWTRWRRSCSASSPSTGRAPSPPTPAPTSSPTRPRSRSPPRGWTRSARACCSPPTPSTSPARWSRPALHGTWQAGPQVFDDADTWLLVGVNPIVAHSGGVPNQNPAKRLKDAVARGMKPIVHRPAPHASAPSAPSCTCSRVPARIPRCWPA